MAIKKVAFEFDPFKETGIKPPLSARDRKAALSEVADFVKTEVLDYVAQSKSPVQGGGFKRTLSKEYRKRKTSEGGSGVADLELSGDMLDALDVAVKGGKRLSLQITGSQAPKADGHCNHSGDSQLPERIFIPRPGEQLKPDIMRGVKRILQEFEDE